MQRETAAVRALRTGFRLWPFMRGRGWLLRLARLLLGREAVRFDVGGGTYIEGPLADWLIVWTFMRRHEADAPFQLSLALVRSGDVVLDVGANFGIWSLLAARRGASVHAFEPVPDLADRLRRHAEENGIESIAVHRFAAGAEEGSLPFFAVTTTNTGASSLAPPAAEHVEIRVPVMPLDAFLERERIERVDLIKVDVEGAEILVFRGARHLLSSADAPAVFFEIDEELCARFGATPRDVKQLLADCGYGIYRWRESAFQPVSIDERHGHEDLFAFKGRP